VWAALRDLATLTVRLLPWALGRMLLRLHVLMHIKQPVRRAQMFAS
jgi:hypothetical protein